MAVTGRGKELKSTQVYTKKYAKKMIRAWSSWRSAEFLGESASSESDYPEVPRIDWTHTGFEKAARELGCPDARRMFDLT